MPEARFPHLHQEVEAEQSDDPPSLAVPAAEPELPEPFPDYFLKKRLPVSSPRTLEFRRRHFAGVSARDWNDWHWQMRNRIRTLDRLEWMLELTQAERAALGQHGELLPMAITPYYMSLLDPQDPLQPLRRTMIPVHQEFLRTPGEADDPLGEDEHSPAPGLVHRYPDRVLFLVHDHCAAYCRYCTRSRVVGQGELQPNKARLEEGLAYIRRTPQIRDVLLSGGDPLTLSDEKLDWLLGELRAIPHVQFVRIGTMVPVVMPQRITPKLVQTLRKHHPLWLSIHFTHPDECTPEVVRACRRLADGGLPLGSQMVLLKGVNDSVPVMRDLLHRQLMMRVRPYYLYQCDPISGSAHFRTTVQEGLDLIRGLRGHTTGYAVPTYVIDAPGGGGKIPLQPEAVLGRDGDDLLLRSYAGTVHRYPDPQRAGGAARLEEVGR
ncbi:MAG: KamA family radical SAM protein [Krumholzibacteria bacterium]|nr:KamA family radical SAM protein [Candidatus Krumholzibacteria bacterium]